ncbi:hypothetical protein [Telluribacter sp. SYSU D00476]|uniref:hypothetical protein n=1 Tax=Telluribacter sp. SYSU D00476 TaxID=2811430 RepID=UPI001FF597DC|nr:hypothetical protein [Telluribacter sp. SYSU D00476]
MRNRNVLFGTLFLLGSALGATSCVGPNTLRNNDRNIGKYDITTIDSCQYIVIDRGRDGVALAHKGDCTNPIHPRVR